MLKTALIVDDSRLARLTLKRLLAKYDIEVAEAEGVIDGESWIARHTLPDIVFMDIMMPDLDGYEGLARLRADPETHDLPVIMYSGDISEEARQKARDAGATGYLPKPADASRLDHLLSALRERVRPAPQPVHQPMVTPSPVVTATEVAPPHHVVAEEGEFSAFTPSYVAPAAVPPVAQPHIPLAVTYVDTTEITRRIDALERQLSLAQEKAQKEADTSKADASADMERQRKEVVHLQRRLAESDRRATISIVIGGIALVIALVAILWQLLHLGG
ncbi:MAG: response regulator [Cardiobacteriaceae bacterium]|nr:response regulator [Cardiobacteriaceae bacterium]